jgi:hypothetical protein
MGGNFLAAEPLRASEASTEDPLVLSVETLFVADIQASPVAWLSSDDAPEISLEASRHPLDSPQDSEPSAQVPETSTAGTP